MLALCLACGKAIEVSEPCCDTRDLLPVTGLSPKTESYTWWTRRMLQNPLQHADILASGSDRWSQIAALGAHARAHGRRLAWVLFRTPVVEF